MVYVELLVLEDFFLNYITLYSVGIILNRITKFKKIFLSSTIGTISLILLFINLNNIIIFFINLIVAIIMSLIAFNYYDILYTIKNTIYMYIVSATISGFLYLININFFPNINNYILNTIYLLSVSPIITYFYIKSIIKAKEHRSNYYQIDIYLKDKPKITLNSFLDTGNKLIDPYSKKPIILVSKKIITTSNEKILLVPYNTISSHSLLSCFSPAKIYIHGVGYRKKVLIGLIDDIPIEGANAILNQRLLERI